MTFISYDPEKLTSSLDHHGYIRVYVGSDHPYSMKGVVMAHRLVMEKHLGRYLEPEEVVHHIDEVKTHNVIENLFLCSSQEHRKIHNRTGGRMSAARRAKIARGTIKGKNKS